MNDRLRFEGKTTVITGAASGMGRAMAVAFARAGANVVLADVLAQEGQAAAEQISKAGGSALFVKTDVSVEAEVASLAKLADSAVWQPSVER